MRSISMSHAVSWKNMQIHFLVKKIAEVVKMLFSEGNGKDASTFKKDILKVFF